ncbi:hypothetical protein KQ302_10755 [Synechococcus sp. CS-602]|uniref:hypothetical protein n=1 Tax=Synechococcaceae TaxID=1890426 RepID=UPI0008FF50B1|nr:MULTISPECIES: hypothetical protein [Synechococcaceae]MCT4365811.1 hypothetical protein [Candidatus Regnicoccus frigidus MAG-AL1]APD49053.1 hypothetical protein BM449_13390 [Synechococcus sp. SynAce01]MCT0201003.1 hypothetical protein [Synechococcus sp. CS-603]MCT0205574.1 hypothetical protein [Synechococcus sp. CS-602]MCT0246889.1 hypothetical protein [Synechococcus sp. CS-601]
MQTAPPPRLPNQVGSLVGGLCREMGRIHGRNKRIAMDLGCCQAKGLLARLRAEQQQLQQRQCELQAIARQLKQQPNLDPLGIEFLLELTRRSPRPGGSAAHAGG